MKGRFWFSFFRRTAGGAGGGVSKKFSFLIENAAGALVCCACAREGWSSNIWDAWSMWMPFLSEILNDHIPLIACTHTHAEHVPVEPSQIRAWCFESYCSLLWCQLHCIILWGVSNILAFTTSRKAVVSPKQFVRKHTAISTNFVNREAMSRENGGSLIYFIFFPPWIIYSCVHVKKLHLQYI